MAVLRICMQTIIQRFVLASCLLFYTWAALGWPFCGLILLPCLLLSRYFWPLGLAYTVWLFLDWNTPKCGSRPSAWARDLFVWKVLANYFPIKTIKTADLPPDRNYIFAAHPHGTLGTCSALMFCTRATEFPRLFPGILVRGVTIPVNFWFPFRREFVMALGVITSDAASIGHVLSRPSGGAVGIVCGGVAEMIETYPDRNRVVLAQRKGFIKLALKYGADLVPVYHFGENRLFINIPSSENGRIQRYRKFVKHFPGLRNCIFPLAYGRSFLSVLLPEKWMQQLPRFLHYGVLPFKQPIVSVVGSPIQVQKCVEPSQQQIDALHAEYLQQLRELFERHKCAMGGLPESAQLEII